MVVMMMVVVKLVVVVWGMGGRRLARGSPGGHVEQRSEPRPNVW